MLNGFGEADAIEAQCRELAGTYEVEVLYHAADLPSPRRSRSSCRPRPLRSAPSTSSINNAVVRHFAPIEQFPVEAWDRAMAVNISAAFHTIRLALPGMRERRWGRIVNLSSVYGLAGTVNRIDYVTSKTALIGITRAVALETVGQGITCNAVSPGSVLTPNIEQRVQEVMAKQALSREAAVEQFLAGKQPSGEFVAADNVAALIAFLCSDAAREITGAVIPIDAGWSAAA